METLLIVLIVGLIMAVLVGVLIFVVFYKEQKFTFPDNNDKKKYNYLPLKGKVTIIGKTNYPLVEPTKSQFIYNDKGERYFVYSQNKNRTLTFNDTANPTTALDIISIDTMEGTTMIWKVYISDSVYFPVVYTIQKEDIGRMLILTDDSVVPQRLFGNLQVLPVSTTQKTVGAMPLLYGDNILPIRIKERCWCNTTFTNCTSGGVNASDDPICTDPKIAWSGQKWLTTADDWTTTKIITLQGSPDGNGNFVINTI